MQVLRSLFFDTLFEMRSLFVPFIFSMTGAIGAVATFWISGLTNMD